jgi:class 3 adenylate cyclase/tetratricopeptide (TPR) repeat protein
MPVCATCGESSPEGARFCQACGTRLGETPPQLRKTITSLFCDLVGSTALAESLADPEAIHDVLTRYLRAMTTVVERHGGTVEKFAGDAIMGTFGVPLSHEDDALRAVRAAVEMREALSSLNSELEARWGVELQLKIGINSGEVLTGDSIGGQALALGDPMNVAARLEQTADPGDIILGEPTLRLVGSAVLVHGPMPLSLKGKAERVAAYRLVSLAPEKAAAERFMRPMVGRTRELQALREAYRRVVRDERSELLVVVGSPGIGKSRLVAAAIAEQEGEATIYAARCPSYGERMAFWPLAEIVRAHAGVVASDDAAAVHSKLVGAVNSLVDDPGERLWLVARLASVAGLAPPEERAVDAAESFIAWRTFLERVASSRPTVLVFEDLHWAEEALLDFIKHLAGCAARLLVLGTARPDLDERRLAGAGVTLLHLDPLATDEIRTLVERLPGQPLLDAMREQVVARAGGNALFAEALVTMISERGITRPDTLNVPDTVEALVAARLDALPSPLRLLALDAAVVGSSIRAEALSSMGGLDLWSVQNGVQDLVIRELLRPAGSPNEFEFLHELVREVAYGQIPRAARSAKHRGFAEWLEEHGADGSSDQLAHHYGRAFDLAVEAREPEDVRRHLGERTFRYQVLAAGHALRATDRGSAATLLARAAAALSEIAEPDLEAVAEAGRLLVTLGRWSETIDLLLRFADTAGHLILRELGVAMCKLHRDNPRGADYRRGQAYLERAAAYGDGDAMASLAGTWKGIDERMVRELYRRASEIDPADPYPLGNLLEYEIQATGDLSPVEGMRDRIAMAIERCLQQAGGGHNLPWAHYDLGKFRLLLGRPYESIEAYAKAIALSPAAFIIETSLASLRRLAMLADRVPGFAWPRDLLALALRAKFADEDASDRSCLEPVVVLAGTSSEQEEKADAYRQVLLEAFRDFTGTIISGGTEHGVSGLAGDLGARYPSAVRTIGYRPRSLPAGTEPDERYQDVRLTEGESFSPVEPLTYWDDLLGAGSQPSKVKMIGIGGGRVAAAEYAIALALGATVGAVRGSGRAADEILSDSHWSSTRHLTPLTPDLEAIRSFLADAR